MSCGGRWPMAPCSRSVLYQLTHCRVSHSTWPTDFQEPKNSMTSVLNKPMTLAGKDVFGGLAPDEGLRLGVVLQQVVVDRAFEIVDAGVAAAADALCRDLGEEAFDEVQPGRACGREMQFEAWVFLQPRPHLGRLVGGVVVENQMDVARFLHGPVDPAEEGQELSGAVAGHAVADDQARFDVQRGEERG